MNFLAMIVGYVAMVMAAAVAAKVTWEIWKEKREKEKLLHFKVGALNARIESLEESRNAIWARVNENCRAYNEHFEAYHSAERKEVK